MMHASRHLPKFRPGLASLKAGLGQMSLGAGRLLVNSPAGAFLASRRDSCGF
jgi:hypothetical protein